ncbi:hypothetical protein [Ranid herpesvirus 3]|uniref:Uncharacterized protein n=1 Tax=Ranid herpesvirus 3 TaxID=1987509 RepID=A0A1X9T599_9VIRU|nr:hypothetical protein [Ranid herpesvirus 3]ARR28878.1 hypothetical protein [Ranid herpesvirus 3]
MATLGLETLAGKPAVHVTRSGAYGGFLVNNVKTAGLTKALPLKSRTPKYTKNNYVLRISGKSVASEIYRMLRSLYRENSQNFVNNGISLLCHRYPVSPEKMLRLLASFKADADSGMIQTRQRFQEMYSRHQIPTHMGSMIDADIKRKTTIPGYKHKHAMTNNIVKFLERKGWKAAAESVNVTTCQKKLNQCDKCTLLKKCYASDLQRATELDLVLTHDGKVILLEIKTTQRSKPTEWTARNNTHQAQMSWYMYALTYPNSPPSSMYVLTLSLLTGEISTKRVLPPQRNKLIMKQEGFRSICKKCLDSVLK